MWKVNILVFLIVFTCRYTHGQLENLIFENEEDIWNLDDLPTNEVDSPRHLLDALCENYNLQIQSQVINCEELLLAPKNLKVDEHTRSRRDTKDGEFEASGEGPPEIEKKLEEPPPSSPFKTQSLGESPKEAGAEIKKDAEVQKDSKQLEESDALVPPQKVHEVVSNGLETNVTGIELLPIEKSPKEDQVKPEEAKTDNNDVKKEEQDNTEASTKTEEPKLSNITQKSEEQHNETTEAPNKTESETTVKYQENKEEKPSEGSNNAEKPAEGTKLELNETTGKNQVSDDAKKGRKATQEDINNQQSGNAVFSSEGNMNDIDKKLSRMNPNESIKSAAPTAVEPKSGAASENPGRKDNKLLITLFVGVLAVGAAAFAYNFIKKRKNRSNAARAEQNGAVVTSDLEEGREMKPLMKTEEQKTNVD